MSVFIIDLCCNNGLFFALTRRRSGFIQLSATVQEPLLASHPARQLLENGIPQTVFGCIHVCVCEKRAKREGVDY